MIIRHVTVLLKDYNLDSTKKSKKIITKKMISQTHCAYYILQTNKNIFIFTKS